VHILVVGLGAIGQRHARNFRSLLGSELRLSAYRVRGRTHVITSQLDADSSKNVETLLGIAAFDDLAAALRSKPDIAVIANPSGAHVDTALACARAGCHLFIEKPLAESLASVDELIDEVDRRRLVAMVGFQLRFHPSFERFRLIIASGELGNLLSVRATVGEYLPHWHRYEDYRESYAARADLGGGVVLTQVHEYDYLCALFGMPTKLFALGGHWSYLELDVEDTASVLMQFSVAGRPLPVHLTQDYLQRPTSRTCEVVGDRGKAVLDFAARTVTIWRGDADPVVDPLPAFDRNELYLREIRHFLDCVANGRQPSISLAEGKKSLEIAIAVKRSMGAETVVELSASCPANVA